MFIAQTRPAPHPAMSATRPLPALRTIPLMGLPVANAEVPQALDWLCRRIETGTQTRVAFLNAHCANLAARDYPYRMALTSADALLPDGSGVALAARLAGHRLVANLNGTDLVPALCQRLARSGRSVFLLGGRPGIAAGAAATLQGDCDGLIIAGTRDGYFGAAEEADVIREINASGADVLLVAMGVPLQDTWLARVAPGLRPVLTIGVGGLFDFLSGRIPRAPAALRRAGLEWSYRLYQEPARMWRRYILGNPEFLLRATANALPTRAALARTADRAATRALDILGAGAGLLALAPLLLATFALVRATSRGPAFYAQTRIGRNGVPFTMFKFRSMFTGAEAQRAALAQTNQHGAAGLTFKNRRDPRITPIGRILRKFSIYELPQLFNVLTGDMSLVGPRPQLPGEVVRYDAAHYRRLAAKPGITCLWQISGRADLAFEQQFELDVAYLRTRSLFGDIAILLRTIPAVLSARGAY